MYPFYYGNYEQNLKDIISNANNQLQSIQNQPVPNVTQNFQLSPTSTGNMKVVNSIDEVQKEIVIADTYFVAKDMSKLWIKSTNGNIRTFDMKEVVIKDEKDIMIDDLRNEIEKLKEQINDKSNIDNVIKSNATEEPSNVPVAKSSKAK